MLSPKYFSLLYSGTSPPLLHWALPQLIIQIQICISTQRVGNPFSLPFPLVLESLPGEHAKFFNFLKIVTTTSIEHFVFTGLEFRSWWLTAHCHAFPCFSLKLCFWTLLLVHVCFISWVWKMGEWTVRALVLRSRYFTAFQMSLCSLRRSLWL